MLKWLKLAKFVISASGWVKGLLFVVLLLGLLLMPVLGLLAIVLLLVLGLVALIASPIRALAHRIK
ncbi:MAG TPA: hypothetical protein VF221_17520 [Chloroflexota bacterium]